MLDPAVHQIPRRGFLGGLLFAAGSGFGNKDVIANAEAAEQGPPQVDTVAKKVAEAPRLEDSGMRPRMIAQMRSLVARPRGLLLCCGPMGSGTTATLYSCLREIDRSKKKIITIENSIQFHLDHITQSEINAKSRQTYAGSLPSILEKDPNVVMIGELSDKDTATIACKAATASLMVLSTMQAQDSVSALFGLLDLGVEPTLVASALTAVLCQRQVRVLCTACKEPYKPKPEFLKKANLPADKIDVFYRRPQNPERVCSQCGGAGFVGQSGIFELLIVSEPMRPMIRNKPSLKAIIAEARKNGMIYLQEDGLRQVVQGQTSIEELLRALTADEPG
jgi:general secretion pathway protein E